MKRVTRVGRPPRRPRDAHKGDFGHVLVLGGAVGMSGAAALAARAALRAGAGLVTVATPAVSQPVVAAIVPEAITLPLPGRPDGRIDPGPAAEVLARHAGRWTVLAAGCGWGAADAAFAADSVALIERAAELAGAAVIDADGLNLLAATGRLDRRPWPNVVITPHPGEMARLLGTSADQVQADRMAAACEALRRFAGEPVVVLKGRGTIVADRGRYYVNRTGGPALAKGGSGDVLTGVIAGLIAGGMARFEAAVLGTWWHGSAGDAAGRRLGEACVLAGDVIEAMPEAMRRGR